MFERIVVPLDGSELAEKALPAAEELSRLAGAPLHLVRVVDLTGLARYGAYGLGVEQPGWEMIAAEERPAARAYLGQTAADLRGRGWTVTTEVVDGPPSRVLVGLSRSGDVMVMASHGRTGMARWFLGSVAEDVVRHATVPVLLVRALASGGAKPGADAE